MINLLFYEIISVVIDKMLVLIAIFVLQTRVKLA